MLFEIAHCLWIRSSFYSNFEKQNRKGSPRSLIYPLKGKLTSFVTKQFFHFEKGTSDSYEIPPTALFAAQRRIAPTDVGGMSLSMHHTQYADFDCKKFDAPHTRLAQDDQVGAQLHTVHHFISPTSKTAMAVFGEHRFVSALANPQGLHAPG